MQSPFTTHIFPCILALMKGENLFRAPRGTIDILPAEQGYYRYIREKAGELCRLYGYGRIDTPVFEDSGLFRRTIGSGTDIVEKEMYVFEDRSGQSMTLRPEGTAPVCRAYLEHGMHSLPQPVRLYYFASIFRYERPQKGRYRQHQQFGVEAIGDGDASLDAEVVEMAWQFFRSLGLRKLTIHLNSIGCQECRPAYLATLKEHYRNHVGSLCPECKARFERNPLRLLDCKKESCQEVADAAPPSEKHLCADCRRHFREVTRYLRLIKVPFKKNHRLVRGLDYYTRTVFEVQPRVEWGAQSALGGGGRYDRLIEELGGRPTPAVGFAVGIDRIALSLQEQGVRLPEEPVRPVFVAYAGDGAKAEAVRFSAELRRRGLLTCSGFGKTSLKAQLRQANVQGAEYAFIFGEDELNKGTVTYRDMETGEQWEVSLDEVMDLLAED